MHRTELPITSAQTLLNTKPCDGWLQRREPTRTELVRRDLVPASSSFRYGNLDYEETIIIFLMWSRRLFMMKFIDILKKFIKSLILVKEHQISGFWRYKKGLWDRNSCRMTFIGSFHNWSPICTIHEMPDWPGREN